MQQWAGRSKREEGRNEKRQKFEWGEERSIHAVVIEEESEGVEYKGTVHP